MRPAQSDLMMLVVGWWESDMTAKHTQKIRAMDSGVLLTAYGWGDSLCPSNVTRFEMGEFYTSHPGVDPLHAIQAKSEVLTFPAAFHAELASSAKVTGVSIIRAD